MSTQVDKQCLAIVKAFSQGKGGVEKRNEDRIFMGSGIACVIDGSKGSEDGSGQILDAILVAVESYIEKCPSDLSTSEFVEGLTRVTSNVKSALSDEEHRCTSSFVFCAVSAFHRQIWRVGDCRYRFAGQSNIPVLEAERAIIEARRFHVLGLVEKGRSLERIQKEQNYLGFSSRFKEAFQIFANSQNREFGFGCINGNPVPNCWLETIILSKEVDEVIIASDGYPFLQDTFELTEDALKIILRQDPLMVNKFPAAKGVECGNLSFDDRTFLHLRLTKWTQ